MEDRELLELAAKAAGIEVMRSRLEDPINKDMLVRQSARNAHHENGPWNPLTDDGDALRLAVRLEIDLCFGANYVIADGEQVPTVNNANDPVAATRRAIVRAAAALAEALPLNAKLSGCPAERNE